MLPMLRKTATLETKQGWQFFDRRHAQAFLNCYAANIRPCIQHMIIMRLLPGCLRRLWSTRRSSLCCIRLTRSAWCTWLGFSWIKRCTTARTGGSCHVIANHVAALTNARAHRGRCRSKTHLTSLLLFALVDLCMHTGDRPCTHQRIEILIRIVGHDRVDT